MEEKLNDQMLIRRGKLEKIAALGFEPYGGKYECTHHSEDIHADAAALEASGEHVKVAGRIMIIRGHGKTAFCTLRDEKGISSFISGKILSVKMNGISSNW